MDRLREFSSRLPQRVVGNAAYGSKENYLWNEHNKVGSYLKYNSFHREQISQYQKTLFLKDNFTYDQKTDSFTCPQGRKLKYKFTASTRSKTGYWVQARHYQS